MTTTNIKKIISITIILTTCVITFLIKKNIKQSQATEEFQKIYNECSIQNKELELKLDKQQNEIIAQQEQINNKNEDIQKSNSDVKNLQNKITNLQNQLIQAQEKENKLLNERNEIQSKMLGLQEQHKKDKKAILTLSKEIQKQYELYQKELLEKEKEIIEKNILINSLRQQLQNIPEENFIDITEKK